MKETPRRDTNERLELWDLYGDETSAGYQGFEIRLKTALMVMFFCCEQHSS